MTNTTNLLSREETLQDDIISFRSLNFTPAVVVLCLYMPVICHRKESFFFSPRKQLNRKQRTTRMRSLQLLLYIYVAVS